jgi:hypothetical protein
MIIQARSLLADLLRKTARAVWKKECFRYSLNDPPCNASPSIGSEILRFILTCPADNLKPRIWPGTVQFYKRISLVIFQQDIVMRLMLFNKRVFQDQSFEFRIGYDHIEIMDFLDHGFHFGQMIPVEIAADSVLQLFCLPHIDYLPMLIQHQINARKLWQIIRFFR